MKTQYDLHAIVQHLRSRGDSPPTPSARCEVERYLFNKWHGLQVVAAQVIARWGGPESVVALREWLMRSYAKRHWLDLRCEAAKCLARCITAADAEWLLDLYFSLVGPTARHELIPAIVVVPFDAVWPRFEVMLRTGTRDQQAGVLQALGRMPDRAAILHQLTSRLGTFDSEVQAAIRQRIARWHELDSRQR
ncbi:MAG: hypothetical protein U0893_14605 [Chloroflexota bacterium]